MVKYTARYVDFISAIDSLIYAYLLVIRKQFRSRYVDGFVKIDDIDTKSQRYA